MNKTFMYVRSCSVKLRVQFHFSGKLSFEFSASFFLFKFRQCEDYSEQSKPYFEPLTFAWQICLLQRVSIFTEYLSIVWLRFHYNLA